MPGFFWQVPPGLAVLLGSLFWLGITPWLPGLEVPSSWLYVRCLFSLSCIWLLPLELLSQLNHLFSHPADSLLCQLCLLPFFLIYFAEHNLELCWYLWETWELPRLTAPSLLLLLLLPLPALSPPSNCWEVSLVQVVNVAEKPCPRWERPVVVQCFLRLGE